MGFDKLKYLFSAVHLGHLRKRFGCFWRYQILGRKRIRLAVVGTASSGKSFVLKDIISSLETLGADFNSLKTTFQSFRSFGRYQPDQKGGNGRTPLYACRQDDHYGATVEHNNPNQDKYDMDFLNIPGEIFEGPDTTGGLSRLRAYTNLRDELKKAKKVFVVELWMQEKTEDEVWIVKYVHGASHDEKGGSEDLIMSFKNWDQLSNELETKKKYKPVKGSERRVSGAYLLKHFFEYDTDSAICSIGEWVKDSSDKLGFDKTDFLAQKYDNSFVFFQYCSLATDIVVCDRVFTPKDGNVIEEMPFTELIHGLFELIGRCGNRKQLHAYLAFRNVDFIMAAHEETFQMLNNETLKGMHSEERHNAIYSLFAYAMQHYLDPEFKDRIAAYSGIPEGKFNAENRGQAVTSDDITTNADLLMDSLVDPKGGNGDMRGIAVDLKTYIKNRQGEEDGQGFRLLFNITRDRVNVRNIVPHVYFSCTPINANYEIYQNYKDDKGNTSDFKKTIDGKDYYFKNTSSVCFGTYQLVMDILAQHQLGNFKVRGLLRIMQNKV